jgi:hypothetical protein
LEALIRQTLLSQEIRRRHVRVSDQEILAAVKKNPSFSDEKGNFDERRFQEMAAGIPDEKWVEMESDVRQALLLGKLQNLVVSEAKINVTDQEVAEARTKYSLKPDVKDDAIRRSIVMQKASDAFENWYKQVRAKAKITIYI